MLPVIEQYANELFGAEHHFGVKYYVDGKETPESALSPDACVESFMGPDQFFPATCCTSYASAIYLLCQKVGIPAVIKGFANEDNATSEFVKRKWHPGGHDFVVVFDEFIIDPWPMLFTMDAPSRVFFDTKHPAVKAMYGPADCWKQNAEAERFAQEHQHALGLDATFEDRLSWLTQLKGILAMWRNHPLRSTYNEIRHAL